MRAHISRNAGVPSKDVKGVSRGSRANKLYVSKVLSFWLSNMLHFFNLLHGFPSFDSFT